MNGELKKLVEETNDRLTMSDSRDKNVVHFETVNDGHRIKVIEDVDSYHNIHMISLIDTDAGFQGMGREPQGEGLQAHNNHEKNIKKFTEMAKAGWTWDKRNDEKFRPKRTASKKPRNYYEPSPEELEQEERRSERDAEIRGEWAIGYND